MKLLRLFGKAAGYGSVLYCVTEYGVEFVMCEGPSMIPTISPHDVLLAEHVSVRMQNIHKNDIVICANPNRPTNLLCKRVKALEGERVKNQIVPDGHVWLEGDNRNNSLDSSTFGAVPYALIRSRAILKLWPPSEFGWLSSHWFHKPPRAAFRWPPS